MENAVGAGSNSTQENVAVTAVNAISAVVDSIFARAKAVLWDIKMLFIVLINYLSGLLGGRSSPVLNFFDFVRSTTSNMLSSVSNVVNRITAATTYHD